MMQKWRYVDCDYIVDDANPSSYRIILEDMVEYNDLYEYVDRYISDTIGGGADLFLKALWDGPDRTVERIMKGFIEWLLEDMETVRKIMDMNAERVAE